MHVGSRDNTQHNPSFGGHEEEEEDEKQKCIIFAFISSNILQEASKTCVLLFCPSFVCKLVWLGI
jgi:hypothetical protein